MTKVKEYCSKLPNCKSCIFSLDNGNYCQLTQNTPVKWDPEKRFNEVKK